MSNDPREENPINWIIKALNSNFLFYLQFVPKPSKANSYCCICKAPF